MSNFILEGESFFVYKKLDELISNKKAEFNPDSINNSFSLLQNVDYYVFFDADKSISEKFTHKNTIFCYPDKNLDLRLDWVKKIKTQSEYFCFEPIPSTDFDSLKQVFPKVPNIFSLPIKKNNLKYKGAKQNYDWFDLCLIKDLLDCKNENVFYELFDGFVDIWKFTDDFWSGNLYCLKQINSFNNNNFEDYFNRIRETSKDYIELMQSGAKTFDDHKRIIPNPIVNNHFRFIKIREKLSKIKKKSGIDALSLFDECLKNVREGSNPKLELIKMFFEYKTNVL
jgi:hypothetical protein